MSGHAKEPAAGFEVPDIRRLVRREHHARAVGRHVWKTGAARAAEIDELAGETAPAAIAPQVVRGAGVAREPEPRGAGGNVPNRACAVLEHRDNMRFVPREPRVLDVVLLLDRDVQ